jgi:geranylgeranyl pyrophosphate synthase
MDLRGQTTTELKVFGKRFGQTLGNNVRERIRDPILQRRAIYALGLTGVRERAFLVKVSSQLCQVRWRDTSDFASAAEYFNASAFTADDVLDRGITRWKRPTVWARWGGAQAWLVAEVLHRLAEISLARVEQTVAAPLRSAFLHLLEGQFGQITSKSLDSTQTAIQLARERTGKLIQACLVGPALLTGSRFRRDLASFGEDLGIAFQLADDILDFLGDPARMGKPVLSDLLNGQPNIVLAHALARKDERLARDVGKWLGKGVESCPLDVGPILKALESLGSFDYACGVLGSYVRRARNALENIPDGKPKRFLMGFLQLVSTVPVNYVH